MKKKSDNVNSATTNEVKQLCADCWMIADTCNIYLVRRGDEAIAIDFGSGHWLAQLPKLGIKKLSHVYLTHAHDDQCHGLSRKKSWPFAIHAPTADRLFLSPEGVEKRNQQTGPSGCPANYMPARRGIDGIRYDMAGFSDQFWQNERIRFLSTPGHGANACTVVVDSIDGKQLVFCGDAVHTGATVWQPYHLEWDHWTGSGALAAWEGLQRLHGIAIDLLCPSHGEVIAKHPRQVVAKTADKLMAFYIAKGQISEGEPDLYLKPEILACGAKKLSGHLYQFGGNGYLLLSDTINKKGKREALVADPFSADLPVLEELLHTLKAVPTACIASHYHFDHCSGAPTLKKKYGTKFWLHPSLAKALKVRKGLPWLMEHPPKADKLWPEAGQWRWNEYTFSVAHWPGQTWWHSVCMTTVDGKKTLFGGDSFQPTTRWNGTGGFCAYNGSAFSEGFVKSAELALQWKPDIVVCGHSTYFQYRASKFRKIIQWAKRAEKAVKNLCPSGDLMQDYYLEGFKKWAGRM